MKRYYSLWMLVGVGCVLIGLNTVYLGPFDIFGSSVTTESTEEDLSSSSSLSSSPSSSSSSSSSLLLWPNFDVRGEQSSILSNAATSREDDDDDNDDEEEMDECEYVTRRIRQLNDCAMSSDCRQAHTFQQLPQPMLNIAYYKAQGFGRVIEHSVMTCLVAASVGRPCLVDMTKRDKYYTFRSFIQSRLDVDVNALEDEYKKFHTNNNNNTMGRNNNYYLHFGNKPILEEDTITEIQQALTLLPKPEVGHWTLRDLQGREFQHILPLVGGDENYTDHPGEAMLRNPQKVAISPNWGTSWFGQRQFQWPDLVPDRSNNTQIEDISDNLDILEPVSQRHCTGRQDERLRTYMQNYMYRPTPLLQRLHQYHKELMFETTTKGTTIVNNDFPYGTIHIRFVILRTYKTFPLDEEGPQAIEKGLQDMANKLFQCLQELHQKRDGAIVVDKWWLVTDKLLYGQSLANYINNNNVYTTITSSTSYQPRIFVETNQTNPSQLILQKIASHRHNGEIAHSIDKDAIGPMGHEYMASSMLDWMALYESKVSLITRGAFAASGAKGNGKYKQDISYIELKACRLFELFHA